MNYSKKSVPLCITNIFVLEFSSLIILFAELIDRFSRTVLFLLKQNIEKIFSGRASRSRIRKIARKGGGGRRKKEKKEEKRRRDYRYERSLEGWELVVDDGNGGVSKRSMQESGTARTSLLRFFVKNQGTNLRRNKIRRNKQA